MNIPFWKNKTLDNLTTLFEGITYTEEWLDIIGYENYYKISSFGRVKSLARKNGKGIRILSQSLNYKGYPTTGLCRDNKMIRKSTHRITCYHFHENPNNKPQVNHKNGDKTCGIFCNLEWNTQSENQSHAHKTGLKSGNKGEKNSKAKLKNKEALDIFNSNLPTKILAEMYNVSTTNILNIKEGRSYSIITNKKYERVTRLSKEAVLNILQSNEKYHKIAAKHNCSISTVCAIRKGRSYTNVVELRERP